MDIGDKVIKDIGEAYIVLHDRVPELEDRIAELERENTRLKVALQLIADDPSGPEPLCLKPSVSEILCIARRSLGAELLDKQGE